MHTEKSPTLGHVSPKPGPCEVPGDITQHNSSSHVVSGRREAAAEEEVELTVWRTETTDYTTLSRPVQSSHSARDINTKLVRSLYLATSKQNYEIIS